MIPFLTNLGAVLLYWIVYYASFKIIGLFPLGFRGPEPLITGAIIAYGQFNPMAVINLFFFFPVRVKSIPFFQAMLGILVFIVDGMNPFMLSLIGSYISWVYLRFYQKRQVDTIGNVDSVGDWSETFALETWFPEPLRPTVRPIANATYYLASKLHLVPEDNSDPLGLGGGFRLGSAEDDQPTLLSTLMRPFTAIAGFFSSLGQRFEGVQLPPDDEQRTSLLGGQGQEESAAARRERMLRAVDNRLASSTPTSPAPPNSESHPGDNKPPPPYQGPSSGF
jgi:hypothetical protein